MDTTRNRQWIQLVTKSGYDLDTSWIRLFLCPYSPVLIPSLNPSNGRASDE